MSETEQSDYTLPYECPHCMQAVDVSEKLLKETIECPRCGKPFQVQPPMARTLNDSDKVGEIIINDIPDPESVAEFVRKRQ